MSVKIKSPKHGSASAPNDEASRMRQEATAVPVNVPEAYRMANNIPDTLPPAAARQIESDYIRQTEGAANREAVRTDREARAADIG